MVTPLALPLSCALEISLFLKELKMKSISGRLYERNEYALANHRLNIMVSKGRRNMVGKHKCILLTHSDFERMCGMGNSFLYQSALTGVITLKHIFLHTTQIMLPVQKRRMYNTPLFWQIPYSAVHKRKKNLAMQKPRKYLVVHSHRKNCRAQAEKTPCRAQPRKKPCRAVDRPRKNCRA